MKTQPRCRHCMELLVPPAPLSDVGHDWWRCVRCGRVDKTVPLSDEELPDTLDDIEAVRPSTPRVVSLPPGADCRHPIIISAANAPDRIVVVEDHEKRRVAVVASGSRRSFSPIRRSWAGRILARLLGWSDWRVDEEWD